MKGLLEQSCSIQYFIFLNFRSNIINQKFIISAVYIKEADLWIMEHDKRVLEGLSVEFIRLIVMVNYFIIFSFKYAIIFILKLY